MRHPFVAIAFALHYALSMFILRSPGSGMTFSILPLDSTMPIGEVSLVVAGPWTAHRRLNQVGPRAVHG